VCPLSGKCKDAFGKRRRDTGARGAWTRAERGRFSLSRPVGRLPVSAPLSPAAGRSAVRSKYTGTDVAHGAVRVRGSPRPIVPQGSTRASACENRRPAADDERAPFGHDRRSTRPPRPIHWRTSVPFAARLVTRTKESAARASVEPAWYRRNEKPKPGKTQPRRRACCGGDPAPRPARPRSTRCESKRGAAGKGVRGREGDVRRRASARAVFPTAFSRDGVRPFSRRGRRACNGRRIFWSIGQDSEREHAQQDPKGGDLCQATAKPWETVVDAGTGTDVQIVCQSVGIGAKDSSNRLVAGSLRSFPQDSWSAHATLRLGRRAQNGGGENRKRLVMQARALTDSLGNHRRLCWPSNCEVACHEPAFDPAGRRPRPPFGERTCEKGGDPWFSLWLPRRRPRKHAPHVGHFW